MRALAVLQRFGVPSLFFLCWCLVAWTAWGREHAVPLPSEVFHSFLQDYALVFFDTSATILRVTVGLLSALLVALPVALWLGTHPKHWKHSEGSVEFFRSIPPILTYPMFLASMGYTEQARLATIAVGAFGVLLLPMVQALHRASPARRATVHLAGIRGIHAVRVLHFYELLPGLTTGLRLAFVQALIISIVTELLVGARFGLGSRALQALQEYRADRLWLTVLVAGLLGRGASCMFASLERRVHWST